MSEKLAIYLVDGLLGQLARSGPLQPAIRGLTDIEKSDLRREMFRFVGYTLSHGSGERDSLSRSDSA